MKSNVASPRTQRFLRVFFATLAIYVGGGGLAVWSLSMLAFLGWGNGPISIAEAEGLQRIWAFGVFATPALESRVFLVLDTSPRLPTNPSPEQRAIYARELQDYQQCLRAEQRRATLIFFVWAVIVSATIASLIVLLRPRPRERSA